MLMELEFFIYKTEPVGIEVSLQFSRPMFQLVQVFL